MLTVKRLATVSRIGLRLVRHHLRGNRRQFSQVLFDSMLELGGVYIKFLQALAIRSDFFIDQSVAQQIRVYEDVETEEIDIIAVLNTETSNWRQYISHVEVRPFAAGSFGQVYRATLGTGKNVIIKVLRPSLDSSLRTDLKIIGLVTHLLNLLRVDSMIDYVALYRDFKDITYAETNYRREAAFADQLYQRYHNHRSIVIPQTYKYLSSQKIIVQDYIGGLSIAEILNAKNPEQYVRSQLGSDLAYQLRELGFEFLRSMFVHGTAQGDPHPGNVKILPNNKVGLIDFGLIAEAPPNKAVLFKLCEEYAQIYSGSMNIQGYTLAVLRLFSENLVYSIEAMSELTGNSSVSRIVLSEVINNVESLFSSRKTEMEKFLMSGKYLSAFSNVINKDNRFGLRLDFHAATFLRSSSMFINLVNALGCRQAVLSDVYSRLVADIPANHPETICNQKQRMSPERAVEIMGGWLGRIAHTDPLLFNKIQLRLKGFYV